MEENLSLLKEMLNLDDSDVRMIVELRKAREKSLSLLKEVLNLKDSDVRAIVDSKLTTYELIFSDSDDLRRCLKVDESVILKLAALRTIMQDLPEEVGFVET